VTLGGEKQRYATIRKDLSLLSPRPNMIDYVRTKATFDWNGARSLLEGLPDGKGMNIAHEAVDRHARGVAGEHVSILWIGKSGERREITYRALRDETNRFANVLRSLGLGHGDRVFTLLGRVPELYIAVLGSLKANCVASPLFSAFGPEPIATRLELGEGVALVTTEALYKRKIEPLRSRLPKLTRVLLVDAPGDGVATLSLQRLLEESSPEFDIPATEPEDMALLHFTSGTTGRPKGAIHVHDAIVTHFITGLRAGSACLNSAPRKLSGFLPGYTERGALRF
jgi:acetyl-CoA synthetase